jgi:hypothetical protein
VEDVAVEVEVVELVELEVEELEDEELDVEELDVVELDVEEEVEDVGVVEVAEGTGPAAKLLGLPRVEPGVPHPIRPTVTRVRTIKKICRNQLAVLGGKRTQPPSVMA